MKKYNLLIFLCILIFSCNNKEQNITWKKRNNYICKDSFDENSQLFSETCYTLDTILLNGSQKIYNIKSKIVKWKWFGAFIKNSTHIDTLPFFIAYYDSNGIFQSFRGNPFLNSFNKNKKLYVEMVMPPNTHRAVTISDSFNNKLYKEEVIEPGETDSTCYIGIKNVFFLPKHQYWLNYQIHDTKKIISEYKQKIFVD